MEPDAFKIARSIADQVPNELRGDTVNGVAAVSIAISLKRIADVVCGDDKRSGIIDVVYDAIQRAKQ